MIYHVNRSRLRDPKRPPRKRGARTNKRVSTRASFSPPTESTTGATLLVNKDARKFYLRANTPRRPRCVQNPRPRPSPAASPIRVMHSRKRPRESLCAFSVSLCGAPISRDKYIGETESEREREILFIYRYANGTM